jgi:Tol biopolymer transport system component
VIATRALPLLVLSLLWLAAGCGGADERKAAGPIDLSELSGRIAFSSGTDDVYAVEADGSGLTRLTSGRAWDFDPSWSPDGSRIAFRSERDGNPEIYVMRDDGSGQRNLSRSDAADWGPEWAPVGETIAFNSDRSESGQMQLFLDGADGERARRVESRYVEYPTWSPDGSRIAFMSPTPYGTENYEIYVMNVDGTGLRRLTSSPGSDGWPAWSPDGKTIAFSSVRDDCSYSDAKECKDSGDIGPFHTLYAMDADGTHERRLSDRFGQFAAWSPDGEYIVFAPGLNVIRADGSGLVQLRVKGLPSEPEMPDWIG